MADTTTTPSKTVDDYVAFLRSADANQHPFLNGDGQLAGPEYAPLVEPAIAMLHAAAAFVEATVDAGWTASDAADAIEAIAGPLYRV